jgi:hypothetical protein
MGTAENLGLGSVRRPKKLGVDDLLRSKRNRGATRSLADRLRGFVGRGWGAVMGYWHKARVYAYLIGGAVALIFILTGMTPQQRFEIHWPTKPVMSTAQAKPAERGLVLTPAITAQAMHPDKKPAPVRKPPPRVEVAHTPAPAHQGRLNFF